MRIFSKFNDYYDHVVAPSDTVMWRRHKIEFVLDIHKALPISLKHTEFLNNVMDKMPRPSIATGYMHRELLHSDLLLLGFCGKLYVIYLIYTNPYHYVLKSECKAYTDVTEFVAAYNKVNAIKVKFEGNKVWHNRYPFNKSGSDAWNNEFQSANALLDLFVEIKSPVFILRKQYNGYEFTVNPVLSDYGIQRIFDPWTAHQEVEMFLSNALAAELKDMPDFGNEIKRDLHGFDDWSFKQVGPKPRKRK